MLLAMSKTFTLGCIMLFLGEKRNESYKRYDEVSITDENSIMRQEFLGRTSFAWLDGETS